MEENGRNQIRFHLNFMIFLVVLLVVVMGPISLFSGLTIKPTQTPAPSATFDPLALEDSMNMLSMIASQTAKAQGRTPAPTTTLLPNQEYWSPIRDVFVPRFTYNSIEWAATDKRTLTSLQVIGCTLRVAGERHLGAGWVTEKSTFQAGEFVFATVLAKQAGNPVFIRYSLANSMVFEIAADVDLAQCQQYGEAVLKTIVID